MAPDAPRRSSVNRVLIGIGVLLIGSYTAHRLRELSGDLPYDVGDPHLALAVEPAPRDTLGERVRAALLSRRSPRVAGDAGQSWTTWPLRGIERERVLRMIRMSISATVDTPPEQRTSQHCVSLATWVAVQALVDQDRVFVVDDDGPPLPPADQARWSDFRMSLTEDLPRKRVAYALIDQDAFPFVRSAPDADPRTFDPR